MPSKRCKKLSRRSLRRSHSPVYAAYSSPPDCRDTYPTAAAQAPSPEVHEVPRIPLKQLTPSTYDQYCGRGIPLVVTGIAFQGRWAPLDIVQRYGDHVVRIEDCESGEVTQSTAGEFFRNFGKISETTQGASACKVKVRYIHSVFHKAYIRSQDWPPSEDFASKFPELQQAFMTALPFPDVQRCDGVLNLAAHFPTNMCPPDLGKSATSQRNTIADLLHTLQDLKPTTAKLPSSTNTAMDPRDCTWTSAAPSTSSSFHLIRNVLPNGNCFVRKRRALSPSL